MECNGTLHYYVTNLQGDVVGILDSNGAAVVQYSYNAWGHPLTQSGTLSDTLGTHNPLRYRGYVFDPEYKLYYLESRYYNSGLGRFQNADEFISTGQGLLGNNMYIYCNNNPVNLVDISGSMPQNIKFHANSLYDRDSFGGGGSIISLGASLKLVEIVENLLTKFVTAVTSVFTVEKQEEKEKVETVVATNSSYSDAYYYGVDMHGGQWKTVTSAMDYNTAVVWATGTAAAGVYGKNAAWGLYTPNADDALAMAITLGGPVPIAHLYRPGEYPHYHPMQYLFAGRYKHFHIWFGTINGGWLE